MTLTLWFCSLLLWNARITGMDPCKFMWCRHIHIHPAPHIHICTYPHMHTYIVPLTHTHTQHFMKRKLYLILSVYASSITNVPEIEHKTWNYFCSRRKHEGILSLWLKHQKALWIVTQNPRARKEKHETLYFIRNQTNKMCLGRDIVSSPTPQTGQSVKRRKQTVLGEGKPYVTNSSWRQEVLYHGISI